MQTPAKFGQDIINPVPGRGPSLAEEPGEQPQASLKPKSTRLEWWLCIAIALVFSAWGMRSVGPYNVIETDAARHAMNGVFLHDLIAQGKFTHVLTFARSYYGQFPALSLPYHPPLFPLIEALFYTVLGVSAMAARLAVALSIFAAAIAMFRLVMATHRSCAVAALSTITFLCLPEALWLGSDVMLEFPALVFTLLAIYRLQPMDGEYTMRRLIGFTVLAAAAVWTKQQTVFLIAVPFLCAAQMGWWRVFRKAPIWISAALFLVAVGALSALSLPFHGAGVNQALPSAATHVHQTTYGSLIVRNLNFYVTGYPQAAGPAGVILMAALLAAICGRLMQRKQAALYTAWAVSSFVILLLLRPFATRYLFFTYPALIVLGISGLVSIVERLTRRRAWGIAAAAAVVLLALVQFPYRTQYLRGPDEAARLIAGAKPKRVLYCGGTDGNFIFHYRALRPDLGTTVITGDKLSNETFTPEGLEEFAHDYGVQYIALEEIEDLPVKRPWLPLLKTPARSMVAEQDIPITSSGRWNGMLRIYRFTNPSDNPKDALSMRMFMIGGMMDFKLGQ